MTPMEIELRTLTPLWTGGVDQVCDRVHETGLIGSLRWWYEALVRGLGGYACDPTSDDRCPDQDGRRCAACELFGCTGWARKFRLRVLDSNGGLIKNAVGAKQEIALQFLELRPMSEEEKWLLANAVEIAARYGAMGGKTTSLRQVRGLVKLAKPVDKPGLQKDAVRQWLRGFRRVKHEPEWADLRRFIFVPNKALNEDPRKIARRVDPGFLLGQKKPEQSRKILVFKRPDRTFAYFRSKETYQKVLVEWDATFGRESIKTGEEVLNEL